MADSSNLTAQAWRKRILNQRSSGQSIRAWCRGNNCQEHAYYWWRTQLGMSPTSGMVRQVEPIAFAEAVVEDKPVATATSMTLRLKSGHELSLPAAMDVEQIAKLLRAIDAPAPGIPGASA